MIEKEDKFSYDIHRSRIQKVQQKLKEGEVLLLFSASLVTRNRDVEYKFRQDSDFYYLTGINEPDSILVLTHDQSIFFCLPKDKTAEIWTGIRLGSRFIKKSLDLTECYENSEWGKKLPELLLNKHTVYYFFGINPDRDRLILEVSHRVSSRARDGKVGPEKIIQPGFLHEMRLRKSKEEIRLIEESASITEEAHIRLMQEVRPGMNECELEAILEETYIRRGAWGGGYGHIVAGGSNACILHYVNNNSELRDGDLVLVDSGAEKNYYTADVTRCFPVGKKFLPSQVYIYELVLAAQKNAIQLCKSGTPFYDIQDKTVRFLSECLIDMGVLKGTLEQVLEKEEYKRFYMHKIGHYLGMDVHDVGKYFDMGKRRKLEDGMVVTIEPGLYFDPNDRTIPKEFRGTGIRIEDNILISGKKGVNLTKNIPKEIQDIENLKS